MKKSLFMTVVILCLTIPFSVTADGQSSTLSWKLPEYTLLARDMSIKEALEAFGASEGIAVISSKAVTGSLSGDFRNMAPLDFLNKVTAMNNLIWYYDGAAIYVYSATETVTELVNLQYMTVDDVRTMLNELGVQDERFPLKTTSDAQLLMIAGPPRYVALVQELVGRADNLRERRSASDVETRFFPLYHTWADDVSLNVSSSESSGAIKGVATLLTDIMKNATGAKIREGESSEQDGNGADELQEKLDLAFQPIIKAENRMNAVIIRDVASRMPFYEKMIKQLDVPQKLVEIAVTSVEMSKNDALDWQLSLAVQGNSSNMDAAAGQNADNLFGAGDLLGKGLAGALTYVGKHVSVSASLSALRQKGKARSISRTTLLTMNNMAAAMTDKQSYHARVVGTEVASLEEVSVGTMLKVKPRIVKPINEGDAAQMWMTISLQDGGFEAISVDSMPLTRSSTIDTQAAVFEGESIILAGYFKDIEEKAGWGIPYLRDIPYIGWLFGGVSKKKDTVQRLFILTPYIIDMNEAELARIQAARQRDITKEETLEDDSKEDDIIRDMRDQERKFRDEQLKKKYKDMKTIRKEELELQRDKQDYFREKQFEDSEEDMKQRRRHWENKEDELNYQREFVKQDMKDLHEQQLSNQKLHYAEKNVEDTNERLLDAIDNVKALNQLEADVKTAQEIEKKVTAAEKDFQKTEDAEQKAIDALKKTLQAVTDKAVDEEDSFLRKLEKADRQKEKQEKLLRECTSTNVKDIEKLQIKHESANQKFEQVKTLKNDAHQAAVKAIDDLKSQIQAAEQRKADILREKLDAIEALKAELEKAQQKVTEDSEFLPSKANN